jgi:Rieske Fe-S protein
MTQFNPSDKVTVDIPLFIRLLEYAREDAKTDMDLHNVAEKAIAASETGKTLTMADYDALVAGNSEDQEMNEIKRMIELANIKVGETHQFALSNGMPAILFRTKTGVFAYSATCTHEGCTVAYQSSKKSLYCPCHGAEFDPFKNGGVITGPTRDALPTVKVEISGDWVVLV